ncbi:protocadherin gamma-C5-like [Denticeps clupeoides]|uniref:protocadherin gamma-C5-like n=1 Tax=Denticeps clupeoides TaxID=299321 RepID=UPI0010A35CDB|nr:protocadherin gamma-C5-like [Denticeps clupeoides]
MEVLFFQKWSVVCFCLLWNTVVTQNRYTIPEELNVGSVVANVAKDLGLSLSEISRRRLRIASETGKQYFSLDVRKGELLVNERLDRESQCAHTVPCVLPLEAVLENPLQLHRIEVEVQDINDNAPSFLSNERVLNIPESIQPGARFPLEKAEDPDVASNTLRSYSLSSNDNFVLNVKNQDGAKIPELVLERPLDREKQAVHTLTLTAVDGGSPVLSGSTKITVMVLDNNDNAPQFERQFYEAHIKENASPGTEVLSVRATDFDDAQNGEVEYFLGDQTPDAVQALFTINSDTGVIEVRGQLDFETANLHKFDVLAKDRGNPRMEGHCSVKVKITDVNDNAPEIVITSLSSPVAENSPVGTVVALISAKDADSGENGKVKLNISLGVPFSLNRSQSSSHYALVTNGPVDRETHSLYEIELHAVDSGSPPMSAKKTVTVTVSDANDNPPMFSQPSYTAFVKENCAPGTILSTVEARDPDVGENARITYSILDSKTRDVVVSSYFYMNADNGSLFSMHSFDYEKLKVFQVVVQATDQGSPPLSSNVTVHVFILDQNDNVPAVIYPSTLMGSVSHQRMPRSAKAGHLVTKVTAVDADSGHNAYISYRLADATDSSLFSVNLYTGEVRTKRSVSEQDDSSQRLILEIKDNGEPVQSTTVTVEILLEEGLHEPVSDFRPKSSEAERKSTKLTFYLIISLAAVSVLSLLTFLILLIKCARNSRGSSGCCIRRGDSDGYKNPNRNLQIQLNTDGPIKYVEVLGGDMMSQSQSFGSYLSPMSEFSDFTLVKPCSTLDFKESLSVLDASLPDSAWTFESQQVRFFSSSLENPTDFCYCAFLINAAWHIFFFIAIPPVLF